MRLFIAVSFPAPLREQLRQAAGRLQGQCLRGRFTLTDNFHLTLAFLGETERRAAAEAAMDRVSAPGKEFYFSSWVSSASAASR